MGNYTAARIEVDLKSDTPDTVLSSLRWLLGFEEIGDDETDWANCPYKTDHVFFSAEGYYKIGSDYCGDKDPATNTWKHVFPEESWSELKKLDSGDWRLVCSSHIKNYDGEILKFVSYLRPYMVSSVNDDTCIGKYMYEERSRNGLLYANGDIVYPNNTSYYF